MEYLGTFSFDRPGGAEQFRVSGIARVPHTLGIIQSSAEILEDYLEQLEPAECKESRVGWGTSQVLSTSGVQTWASFSRSAFAAPQWRIIVAADASTSSLRLCHDGEAAIRGLPPQPSCRPFSYNLRGRVRLP